MKTTAPMTPPDPKGTDMTESKLKPRDLVRRIRERTNDAPLPSEYLLDEAADEIERLRIHPSDTKAPAMTEGVESKACPSCKGWGRVHGHWCVRCGSTGLEITPRAHPPEVARLIEAASKVEPFLDAIICYASTMDEHAPNKIAHEFRTALAAIKGTDA